MDKRWSWTKHLVFWNDTPFSAWNFFDVSATTISLNARCMVEKYVTQHRPVSPNFRGHQQSSQTLKVTEISLLPDIGWNFPNSITTLLTLAESPQRQWRHFK